MPDLVVAGVTRMFGENLPIVAIRDVSLSIPTGDFLAVVGPSGSGKSTLLNIITLIDSPSAGKYDIGEVSSAELTEQRRARLRSQTFGFIFQSFHLMPRRTALENVELGLLYRGLSTRERRARATVALTVVGLDQRRDVEARKLSGGERQRVAIARATVGGAPVIVADEPTGNLDTEAGAVVVDLLTSLNQSGTTVLLVTHDPDVASAARRRVALRDGRLVSDSDSETSSALANDLSLGVSSSTTATDSRAATKGSTEGAPMPGRPSKLLVRDLFRESWQAIRGRPGRSGALVAAVALAVGLIAATVGLTQTASAQVSNSFDVRRNREVTLTFGADLASSAARTARSNVENRLRQVRGISSDGLLERYDPIVVSNPTTMASPVTGVNVDAVSPHLFSAVGAHIDWAAGRPQVLGHRETVLGANLAQDLTLGPLDLNPIIQVDNADYAVVGIATSATRAPGLIGDMVVGSAEGRAVSQIDSAVVFITTKAGAAPQVARQAPIAINPIDAQSFSVQAPVDPSTLRATVQSDVRSTLLALTVVAVLASMLGVANSMLLSVLERIGELGLRRAIGARPSHILSQISVESMILGVVGGLVGVVVGVIGVLSVTIARQWQPVLDLRIVPLCLLGGAVVGALGGLPASVRASRIQPADALKR